MVLDAGRGVLMRHAGVEGGGLRVAVGGGLGCVVDVRLGAVERLVAALFWLLTGPSTNLPSAPRSPLSAFNIRPKNVMTSSSMLVRVRMA